MSAMASQVTSLTIVYPSVYPGADQRKQQSSALMAFVCVWGGGGGDSPGTGEFPAQRASNAGNVPFDDVIMNGDVHLTGISVYMHTYQHL